jgi:hypothetical protein
MIRKLFSDWVFVISLISFSSAMLSMGIWLFYQRRYIVRRYEVDSNLHEMKSCQLPHYVFVRGIDYIMALNYSGHLFLVCVLSHSILHKLPGFSDLGTKQDVLRFFSKKAMIATVVMVASGLVIFLLSIIYYFLKRVYGCV